MISKVSGYGGHQSYSDIPYPTLKNGKKTLDSNTVYQGTIRPQDELNFYHNTQRYKSVYDKNVSSTVAPKDYLNPLRVTKSSVEKPLLQSTGKQLSSTQENGFNQTTTSESKSIVFADQGVDLMKSTMGALIKSGKMDFLSTEDNSKSQTVDSKLYEKLRSGTEHWKSTYNAGIKDPYQVTKASRPEWSLPKEPHTVSSGPLQSIYKATFGERGEDPRQKLGSDSEVPPKSTDPLKLGTTQTTYHVPGYTGYIPKTLTSPDYWDQAHGVNPRKTFLKSNITENYHSRIPGYSGHEPRNAANDRGNLRQYCFSTEGEKFH